MRLKVEIQLTIYIKRFLRISQKISSEKVGVPDFGPKNADNRGPRIIEV